MRKQSTTATIFILTLILAPLALFMFLQLRPDINLPSPQPVNHFYIVSFVSLVALVVAIFVLTGVGGIGDAKAILVGMAFVAISAIFTTHGAYTPGVIFENTGPATGWSARLALLVGALLLIFAVIDLKPNTEQWIIRNRRLLWLIFALLYVGHLWLSSTMPAAILPIITSREFNIGLAIVVILLFMFEARQAWQAYQREGRRLQLALTLGLPWLAMAQLSQTAATIWTPSWWMYHYLMLTAFLVCMITLVVDYEHVLNFDLSRYFVTFSILIAIPLAAGLGELGVRITGDTTTRWPFIGASLAAFFIFFILVLLVVRHGASILDQRARALEREQEWRADFTNLLVHDLKTPLTAIRGNLDILISGLRGPIPEEQKLHLERARQSGTELGMMIENLLDVERLESGAMHVNSEPCNFSEMLRISVDTMREAAALSGLAIDASIPESLPRLNVDEGLMRRVISNLLLNALKFAPANGYVYLRASSSPKNVMIAVIDNGPGVPAKDRKRIFEKFEQGENNPRGGAGLGLTFCKLAVEAHGGEIWVEDNPGGTTGSAFIFHLPLNNGARG